MSGVFLALAAAYGHLVYPAWLALRTRGVADPAPPSPASWPAISVVVPAYREETLIADKVADTRANGYPGELEVIVVADDPDTATAARGTDAILVEAPERLGKAEALNRGFAAAGHEVVVMTDANTRLAAGALEHLVRWFEDPAIGAVAGEKQVASSEQGAYWRFESFLKQRESRAGIVIGIVGELAAVRRSAYRTLPGDLVVDDMWVALDVVEAGARIHYESRAVAVEEPSATLAEEWERRTRVSLGVLDVLWRRRGMLVASPVAPALWGHRLVRSSVGPVAHLILLLRALARLPHPISALFVAGHAAGGAALAVQARGGRPPAPLRPIAQVLFLQAVALGGLVRYLRGDRPSKWRKASRSGLGGSGQRTSPPPSSGMRSSGP